MYKLHKVRLLHLQVQVDSLLRDRFQLRVLVHDLLYVLHLGVVFKPLLYKRIRDTLYLLVRAFTLLALLLDLSLLVHKSFSFFLNLLESRSVLSLAVFVTLEDEHVVIRLDLILLMAVLDRRHC